MENQQKRLAIQVEELHAFMKEQKCPQNQSMEIGTPWKTVELKLEEKKLLSMPLALELLF